MKLLPLLTAATFTIVATALGATRVVSVAGGGAKTEGSLLPNEVRLGSPFGVDFDGAGNLYLVEMTGQRVRKLDGTGRISVIAGTGTKGDSGDGGPAVSAQLNGMHSLAVARNGDVYLADTWNNRVRKIEAASGVIRTVAGTGEKGFGGDGGSATQARFGGIYCVSMDPKGQELLLADLDNLRVRAVNLASGRVRTVAGNGEKGVPANGAKAAQAPLVDPRAVIADREGRVYILERSGHALRVVERDGTIRTVVGASGKAGHSGDGGPALQAELNGPKHLCLDRDGGIVIADTENHRIRKYTPGNGRILGLAGSGRKGDKGLGGPPLEVELNQPHGVTVHPDGTLYICDSSNHRVLKVIPE